MEDSGIAKGLVRLFGILRWGSTKESLTKSSSAGESEVDASVLVAHSRPRRVVRQPARRGQRRKWRRVSIRTKKPDNHSSLEKDMPVDMDRRKDLSDGCRPQNDSTSISCSMPLSKSFHWRLICPPSNPPLPLMLKTLNMYHQRTRTGMSRH